MTDLSIPTGTTLAGKVALITGAASGLGKATAEKLAAHGATVCVVDHDGPGAQHIADTLDGIAIQADCGDRTAVDAAFDRCTRELGGVDIAHLNAGISLGTADLTEMTDEMYDKIMRINVNGVFFGVRAAIRAMKLRGGGSIVATSSLAGISPVPFVPVYAGGKHFVVGLIRSLAPTLAVDNITANAVSPGLCDTNIIPPESKPAFIEAGVPMIPASQVADAIYDIITTGVTGECWVVQHNRATVPYVFTEIVR